MGWFSEDIYWLPVTCIAKFVGVCTSAVTVIFLEAVYYVLTVFWLEGYLHTSEKITRKMRPNVSG